MDYCILQTALGMLHIQSDGQNLLFSYFRTFEQDLMKKMIKKLGVNVVYFDQLLGAARTQKLFERLIPIADWHKNAGLAPF